MATPLTDAIEALTRYANEITGQTDADLSAAVATLTAGYGAGGWTIDDYINHNLTGAVESSLTTITGINFQSQKITSVSFPNVTSLKTVNKTSGNSLYLFAECEELTSFSAPLMTAVSDYLLYGCTALETLDTPALLDTGNSMCYNCSSLTTVVLPAIQTLYQNAFRGCTSLTTIDILGNLIHQNVFNGDTSLATLIIRKSSVITLNNINSFTGTPFASGGSGGTIYVPSSLISTYQSASNWSTLNGYGTVTWKAIEGSIYETQYADGTPISTEE